MRDAPVEIDETSEGRAAAGTVLLATMERLAAVVVNRHQIEVYPTGLDNNYCWKFDLRQAILGDTFDKYGAGEEEIEHNRLLAAALRSIADEIDAIIP